MDTFKFRVLVDDLEVASGSGGDKEEMAGMAFHYAIQYVEEVDRKLAVIITGDKGND